MARIQKADTTQRWWGCEAAETNSPMAVKQNGTASLEGSSAVTHKSKHTLTIRVCSVTRSWPTLCDPMDCRLPGSSVHGIFQARVLEWVAIAFSETIMSWCQPGDTFNVLVCGGRGKSHWLFFIKGIPCWLSSKNLPAKASDMGSIPGSGRSPWKGNGNPLQYSCMGNSMNRALQATVHGITNSQTQLSN